MHGKTSCHLELRNLNTFILDLVYFICMSVFACFYLCMYTTGMPGA